MAQLHRQEITSTIIHEQNIITEQRMMISVFKYIA